ncbi:MAG: RNA polymerase sigma factor [Wenzhouxiangellaceae bacterium]
MAMSLKPEKPSFDQLWAKLAGHVRFAISRHKSRDVALAADDLLQEVRLRVWQVYQGDRNSALNTSYYMKAINSAIIDSLRRYRGTLAHSIREESEDDSNRIDEIDAGEPGPDVLLEQEHREIRLANAIAGMPSMRARAVSLYLQGFSIPEIANLLACDENRAHNLTYRGIRDLKKRLSDPS